MKLIAHRGLFSGPNKDVENHPDQILKALDLDFDVEVDLRIENNKLFLGHDFAQYQIDENFLNNDRFWIHAKNLDALYYLLGSNKTYFWHQEDNFTLTSNGYIWAYPDQPLTDKSIRLMPEWKDPSLSTVLNYSCYGICSDYVEKIKNIIYSHLPKFTV